MFYNVDDTTTEVHHAAAIQTAFSSCMSTCVALKNRPQFGSDDIFCILANRNGHSVKTKLKLEKNS